MNANYFLNFVNKLDLKQITQKSGKMFDQDDYVSDQQQNVYQSHKAIASSKVLTPSSNTDFNHLTGDGQSLLKMMKERGIDLTDNEIKKIKVHHHSAEKNVKQTKGRSGFFDGGASATLEQLIKALNKSLSKADPQQASAILTYILQKKNISSEDLNKFGVMKCKILFGLGAYKDCEQKAQQLVVKANSKLKAAVFSNYLAKCKQQNNKVFEGYIDLLRAKTLINQVKLQEEQKRENQQKQEQKKQQSKSSLSPQSKQQKKQIDEERRKLEINFKDSEVDSVLREIDYTEMQYNIKMSQVKNCIQVVHPYFQHFRHRRIKQVVCGDFHVLFLVEGSFDNLETTLKPEWQTEVFAMGENGVGQAVGKPSSTFFKEPVLIPQLSGKGITGIFAFKQTSLAWNNKGQIFEWGVKQNRNNQISMNYTVGEQIQSLQKGSKHYALLTKSKKFYTWGQIQSRGAVIYKQAKPHMQPNTNVVNFSCGSSCVICVDSSGEAFALGNNQFGQTCMKGQYFTKAFKKIPDNYLGKLKKVFCIADCTFFVNYDDEIYFSGKYSHNKQVQQSIRQAQFGGEFRNLISLCGHIGCYYLTNEAGQVYKWDVDSNVKFRLYKQNPEVSQRYVAYNKGQLFRVKSQIQPEYCSVKSLSETSESYEQIKFELELNDRFGYYGNKQFMIAPRCQIHLSTYEMTKDEVLKENKEFLEKYKLSTSQNRILLNQIIDPKLYSYKITRNQDQPWKFELEIVIDTAGKYFFYVLLEETLLYGKQLYLQVSAKESEESEKNLAEKKAKQEQRRRRAEQEKRRLLEQKMRKEQQQEQKRKETQRRAQQALKKYMKQQQEQKLREMEERRARKQLQTGGGFDLSKLVKKKSDKSATDLKVSEEKQIKTIDKQCELMQKTTQSFKSQQSFMKSSQSFLPDINARPSSKRKLNIRKDSLDSAKKGTNPLQKMPGFTNDSKGFLQTKTKDIKQIGKNFGVVYSSKLKQINDLNKSLGGAKTIVKRGLSKSKK